MVIGNMLLQFLYNDVANIKDRSAWPAFRIRCGKEHPIKTERGANGIQKLWLNLAFGRNPVQHLRVPRASSGFFELFRCESVPFLSQPDGPAAN